MAEDKVLTVDLTERMRGNGLNGSFSTSADRGRVLAGLHGDSEALNPLNGLGGEQGIYRTAAAYAEARQLGKQQFVRQEAERNASTSVSTSTSQNRAEVPSPIVTRLREIPSELPKSEPGFFSKLVNGIKGFFSTAAEVVSEVGSVLVSAIGQLFKKETYVKIGGALSDFCHFIFSKETWQPVVNFIKALPGAIKDFCVNICTDPFGKGAESFKRLIFGIKDVVVAIADGVGLVDLFKANWKFLTGDFAGAWEHLKLSGSKFLTITGLPQIWQGIKHFSKGEIAEALECTVVGACYLALCWTGGAAVLARKLSAQAVKAFTEVAAQSGAKIAQSLVEAGINKAATDLSAKATQATLESLAVHAERKGIASITDSIIKKSVHESFKEPLTQLCKDFGLQAKTKKEVVESLLKLEKSASDGTLATALKDAGIVATDKQAKKLVREVMEALANESKHKKLEKIFTETISDHVYNAIKKDLLDTFENEVTRSLAKGSEHRLAKLLDELDDGARGQFTKRVIKVGKEEIEVTAKGVIRKFVRAGVREGLEEYRRMRRRHHSIGRKEEEKKKKGAPKNEHEGGAADGDGGVIEDSTTQYARHGDSDLRHATAADKKIVQRTEQNGRGEWAQRTYLENPDGTETLVSESIVDGGTAARQSEVSRAQRILDSRQA